MSQFMITFGILVQSLVGITFPYYRIDDATCSILYQNKTKFITSETSKQAVDREAKIARITIFVIPIGIAIL